MNLETIIYHQDPAHGWLEVPHHMIAALGIADKITFYSYRDDRAAYLEEDCDASLFMRVFKNYFGVEPKIEERICNGESPIRNKARYCQPVLKAV